MKVFSNVMNMALANMSFVNVDQDEGQLLDY